MALIIICDVCGKKLKDSDHTSVTKDIRVHPDAPCCTIQRDFCKECYGELVDLINSFYEDKKKVKEQEVLAVTIDDTCFICGREFTEEQIKEGIMVDVVERTHSHVDCQLVQ